MLLCDKLIYGQYQKNILKWQEVQKQLYNV